MRPGFAHHLTQQVARGSQGVVGLLAAELGCKVFAYVSSTQRGGVRFGKSKPWRLRSRGVRVEGAITRLVGRVNPAGREELRLCSQFGAVTRIHGSTGVRVSKRCTDRQNEVRRNSTPRTSVHRNVPAITGRGIISRSCATELHDGLHYVAPRRAALRSYTTG